MRERAKARSPLRAPLLAAMVWALLPTALMGQLPAARWSITSAAHSVARGDSFVVRITANISAGTHIYAIDQASGGPVATKITLQPGSFTLSGAVRAPIARTAFDSSFQLQVRMYTNAAEFVLPIRVARTAATGQRQLRVDVTYEACTARVCNPAVTEHLVLPVRVR